MNKLEFDKNRFRVKFCPCGKDNKDGKFTPYKGHDNKGYCHSCDKTFIPTDEPAQIKCLFVEFDSIEDYSEKSKKIIQKGMSYYVPKSQIYGITLTGCFVSEWHLLNNANTCKLVFSTVIYKHYTKGSTIEIEQPVTPLEKPISFIPISYFNDSFNAETNNFLQYLKNLFGPEIADDLKDKYLIGNSNHWKGATVFWQKDIEGNIRTGKVMQYNPTTGNRIKEPKDLVYWIHKKLKLTEFNLKQCLFGEQLINQYKSKTIAIVESEKTAIIASVYLSQFIWVSVGCKKKLNEDIIKPLKDRTIILFPDINGLEDWTKIAKELSHIANISVSDILNKYAIASESKYDIADYLIQFNFKDFNKPQQQPASILHNKEPIENIESWESEIVDLIEFFENITPPESPIQLNEFTRINNIPNFINSHFQTVWHNRNKPAFKPYLNRLQALKTYLKQIA